jgi:predicted XRE-type DNA-binding protein
MGIEDVTPSSGNVFADLGLPNPEEHLLKAELAFQIKRFIKDKGWTQAQAAQVIGIEQPKVSLMIRGQLAGISVERLLSIVNRLGHSVEVRISDEEQAPEEARTMVRVA